MSVKFQHARGHGTDYVVVYFFEKAGDQLPQHQHNAEEYHDVTCIAGEVVVQVESYPDLRLLPLQRAGFDGSRPHTVVAQQPSITVHRYTNGRPSFYDQLPPTELVGELP